MGTATAPAASAAGGTSYGTPGYRLYVLLVLTLVYTLNFIDRNLLAVIAPAVIPAFHLSDADYGFLNGPPFAIFYAVLGIPIAMAADRYNRIIIIAICISLWSIMAALCGFATSFLFLLIARIGVAVGEAGGTPPSNSIIGDYFKPKSRANALAIFAMGVTIGGALSNYFGGPIVKNLNGAAIQKMLESWHWDWAVGLADWQHIDSWRVAFVLTGAPGLLVALLLLLTVKEPPRGYSDPPGTVKQERASILETLKEVAPKPTFWTMAMGASLTALVGYGLTGFQAPMAARLHNIDAGTFALDFGGPLAICSALGTFFGGFVVDRATPRLFQIVSIVPAVGILLAIPLYIYAYYLPTDQVYSLGRPLWCLGAFCHYSYLGSQYTIGQGVVSQRGRASSVAILLLLIALIGNGLGPLITGALSDMFMGTELKAHATNPALTVDLCRNAAEVAKLAAPDQAVCKAAYGEGLRQSMTATALIFIPAAVFFLLSALTLRKDMVAKPV
ncbi:MAG TPA: MFS transporter [Hyphomonadaceae bacterium]|nr:MFS transporter [Hyphomonadaceae bacterium]